MLCSSMSYNGYWLYGYIVQVEGYAGETKLAIIAFALGTSLDDSNYGGGLITVLAKITGSSICSIQLFFSVSFLRNSLCRAFKRHSWFVNKKHPIYKLHSTQFIGCQQYVEHYIKHLIYILFWSKYHLKLGA